MSRSPWNTSLIVACCATTLACLLPILSELFPGNILHSLELDTFDWRVRAAGKRSLQPAPNLVGVYLDDNTITNLSENYMLDFPYPRWVHGRVIRELNVLEADAIAFDILFNDRRHDTGSPHNDVITRKQEPSDEFFARQLAEAGNVILASGPESSPANLFRTNTQAVAHVTMSKDHDGVMRRIQPFIEVDGDQRWHMGIVLAAHREGWNLDTAVIEPRAIRLTSKTSNSVRLPLDRNGMLLVDWALGFDDDSMPRLRFDQILISDDERQWAQLAAASGNTMDPPAVIPNPEILRDSLVLIGSVAEGNNVSDLGATPLAVETPLVITHMNVANMLLNQRFIRQFGVGTEMIFVLLFGILASIITLKIRPAFAGLWIVGVAALALLAGHHAFVDLRIWFPMVTPLVGGLGLPYLALVTFRLIFEETEQQRVKKVFKSLVSPNVVNELLSAERLSLGGARREITVLFADIRGFTQMTDTKQSRAEAFVKDQKLEDHAAEKFFDENSAEVLSTVNSYLALIADVVKEHDGTLDKYIGDCVMAFWGAPTPNEQHAVSCVRAAIDAQRAIYRFNVERHKRNQEIDATGSDEEKLDLLSLGTGINSGMATVGLMGSQDHISNYTVFGSAINLASRLEGLSGRSRIFIGESTFNLLKKYDPELAATCELQPATTVKGIKTPITHYEVPWRENQPETS